MHHILVIFTFTHHHHTSALSHLKWTGVACSALLSQVTVVSHYVLQMVWVKVELIPAVSQQSWCQYNHCHTHQHMLHLHVALRNTQADATLNYITKLITNFFIHLIILCSR